MTGRSDRWVARLTPTEGTSIDDLLRMPLGLDVWQRDQDGLVVAATSAQLDELERRRLARVERHRTVAEFEAQHRRSAPPSEDQDGEG